MRRSWFAAALWSLAVACSGDDTSDTDIGSGATDGRGGTNRGGTSGRSGSAGLGGAGASVTGGTGAAASDATATGGASGTGIGGTDAGASGGGTLGDASAMGGTQGAGTGGADASATGGTAGSGTSGGSGAAGASSGGVAGTSGAAGTLGSAGSSGTSGGTGTDASAGTGGTLGSGGALGTAGSSGSAGTAGSSGATGSGGTLGSSGASGSAGTAGSSGATGSAGTLGSSGTSGSGGTLGSGGVSGSAGTAGSAGKAGSAGAGGSAGADGGVVGPKPQFIPQPTGTCPTFTQGTVTFSPSGIPARNVQIWISSAAQTLNGPLVFYWHGTGSSPTETIGGLGNAQITAITNLGGIVAAPFNDPAAGTFPWFLVSGTALNDLRVADEVLACAIQRVGVDLRRIHSLGMSAGGLQTTQMSWRRSGYLASVVTYSGGQFAMPPNQDPTNSFPAMIFHGGSTDVVFNTNFQTLSQNYRTALRNAGHFAFICNHNGGHTIPSAGGASAWRFFQDHPFGTNPSPYANGLPSGIPTYCSLN